MPNYREENVLAQDGRTVLLPLKPTRWTDNTKLENANALAAWLTEQLNVRNAKVALISRCGFFLTPLFDQTGMAHSGIVFRHPDTEEWVIYNLYGDPETRLKTSKLWQQDIVDFFYTADSKKRDAMLLFPDMALQEKLLHRLLNTAEHSLLPDNEHFNLIAPLDHPVSFNCTKWLLMNLYSAHTGITEIPALLEIIKREHQIPTIKAGSLTRVVLNRLPDVRLYEYDPPTRIRTTTVGSLYASPLFKEKIFYTNRKITQTNDKPGWDITL